MMQQTPPDRGLAPEAYEEIPGDRYPPYVAKDASPREFSLRAVLLGIVFGSLFGAANAYLGLRVGLTISTSIPIAVLTVLAFIALPPFGRLGAVLEANLSQTIGSASSSLASGMIFTIPALFLWGFQPPLLQLIAVCVCGGLLGALFMIPLRKALIAGEHGRLPYPEGMACAEVLVAADRGGAQALPIFKGILTGGIFKLLGSALRLWKNEFSAHVPLLPKAEIALEAGPALLGVGYILGIRTATVMFAGSLTSWLVIIPLIALWGESREIPFYPESTLLIRDMTASQLWTRYVRYIGAGAVACAGIVTLVRSFPTMWASFRVGFEQIRRRLRKENVHLARTDRDLSLATVGAFLAAVILFMAAVPWILGFLASPAARLFSAFLITLFAFFFVTVSSRIVGLVGVTSNPTSGMAIATLLGTTGIFLFLGWQGPAAMAQALLIGAVVATAASVAGDMSQDLKTGFLLGATPRKQQIGELIGVLTSATFVCLALIALAKAYGFGTKELPAPQAMLMKIVVEGVLSRSIPWGLVFIGVGIAGVAAFFRLPLLALAVGIYLPVATFSPVFVGGLIRWWVERKSKTPGELTERREKGVLFGSGLVGGEGLLGVGIACFALVAGRRPQGVGFEWAGPLVEWMPLILFSALAWLLYRSTRPGAPRP